MSRSDIRRAARNFVVFVALLLPVGLRAQTGYTISEGPKLPGALNAGTSASLNNSGVIAGNSMFGPGLRAYIVSDGQVVNLGTLGGNTAGVVAINSSSQAVGWSTDSTYARTHAFLYSQGRMTDLGTLGGSESQATDINDAGIIVGWSTLSDQLSRRGFVYSNGAFTTIPTLGGGGSSASAINRSGVVVGVAGLANGNGSRAFAFANGRVGDLGTLGGNYSEATAINDSGQIVGMSLNTAGQYHACLFANGIVTDLGTLGGTVSHAYDINNSGVIVGTSNPGSNGTIMRGYVYRDGKMVDVNTLLVRNSGWVVTNCIGINDSGLIIASAERNQVYATLLLTPTVESPTPQPAAPVISAQPSSIRAKAGDNASFTVGFTSSVTASVQWRKNGVAIAGATDATFTLSRVSSADVGSYDAVVINSAGSTTSAPATLAVDAGRLKNMSARMIVGQGAVLTTGFVADSAKTVLIRGVGSTLSQFGVPAAAVLQNPTIQVFNASGIVIAQNDDFIASVELTRATSQAGAFALGSAKDSALIVTLQAGAYTAQIKDADNKGGDCLIEVYDLD